VTVSREHIERRPGNRDSTNTDWDPTDTDWEADWTGTRLPSATTREVERATEPTTCATREACTNDVRRRFERAIDETRSR
jgi:hypothetical protein